MSYLIWILSDIVPMNNFLHYPPTFSHSFKHQSEIPRVQYCRFFSAMAFTFEHVKSLLQRDLVIELEKVKINIVAKIKQVLYLSQSKLYEHLTVLKTVCRDLLVERDIPGGRS